MCPPGVDQTGRLPQVWSVIVPELLQSHEIHAPPKADLDWSNDELYSRVFNPEIHWDAWGKLARPALSASTMNPSLYSARVPGASSRLSALQKLSNELLEMILQHLSPEKADTVALGLSCQFLWQVVLRHIHARYLKSCAPWAGKKLALQGSYSTDLPEAFRENGLVESITGPDGSWFGNMCQARRFFWAHEREDIATPCSEEAGWTIAAQFHRDAAKIPETCWWTIEEELGCSYLFPKDQEWLLRNLTTREMVSSEVFRGSNYRKTRSSKSRSVSFDDVMLMQTCWTDSPSFFEMNVIRGPWAGHRFDIVTLEMHEAEEKLNEWSNVSMGILEEAERLRGRLLSDS